jgi:hypothetical protein
VKLSEAVNQFKDQWIAFRISREGDDPEGEVVVHDADRSRFRERMRLDQIRNVYITYAGAILPEGYVALF